MVQIIQILYKYCYGQGPWKQVNNLYYGYGENQPGLKLEIEVKS